MDRYKIIQQLPDALLPWYHSHKRDLPWRRDKDPYHIWLSEIMLQQTRVEAVKGYYGRFLENIPQIADLAKAEDDLLHKLWEGLGYYSRVRNLKIAAQKIMTEYHGVFPTTYSEVFALPGIGEYTAGAICSIAYNMKTPAVDGNVLRVVSRITNDDAPIDQISTKRKVNNALREIYPDEAGDFTQALMELGATVCVPNGTPDCEICPCKTFCLAHKNGTEQTLPVKSAKRPRRREKMTLFVMRCGDRYALQKRPNKGLLAGLWQFPNVQGHLNIEESIKQVEQYGLQTKEIIRQVEKKHIFTHIEWEMCGVYLEVENINDAFVWHTAEEVRQQAALPTAFRQFWEETTYV